jgi:alkylated DNA repair dioxygenase AlkB
MADLFQQDTSRRRLTMDGADVVYHPAPDLGDSPDALFAALRAEIPWEQRAIRIQGREIAQPRLTAWLGTVRYRYSGIDHAPRPLTPVLEAIRQRLELITGATYNSVLCNLYRTGRDSIGMHADDERELGLRPTIASVSLGSTRTFDFRRKDKTGRPVHVPLEHGSLIVMSGDTQRNWLHGISKVSDAVGERINLTFRLTHPS